MYIELYTSNGCWTHSSITTKQRLAKQNSNQYHCLRDCSECGHDDADRTPRPSSTQAYATITAWISTSQTSN